MYWFILMDDDKNIVDALLESNRYIVMISGLDKSPIRKVSEDLLKSFNKYGNYALELDFMHLPIGDTSGKIDERLKDCIENKIYLVKSQTSPKIETSDHIVYINVSLNDKLIGDKELMQKYKSILERNNPNKFFNYRPELDYDEFIDKIFMYLIDDIERKVYGNLYSKLNHKVFNSELN